MAEANLTPKPDLDALFQSVGSKLGWFQFKDVDSAIKSLSQSGKKKSSRSRVVDTSKPKNTPSKSTRKSSKDKDVNTKKKSNAAKPKATTKNSEVRGETACRQTREKSFDRQSLSKSVSYNYNGHDGASINSSPDELPVESTRIGSSVFRTGSNSFVNITLSPVNASASVNLEDGDLEDSYKALGINARGKAARRSKAGDLDVTDQNYATCFPDEDDVFYSVLDPKGNNSADSDPQVSGKTNDSAQSSDYVEVDDKAVSTGSLELQQLESEDLGYEQDRTFFGSWAIRDDTGEKLKESLTQKMSGLGLIGPESSDDNAKSGEVISNPRTEVSDVSNGSTGSGFCEVEDKCVGTEGALSDFSANKNSSINSSNNSDKHSSSSVSNAEGYSPSSQSNSTDSSCRKDFLMNSPDNDSPGTNSPQNHFPSTGPSSQNDSQPHNVSKYFDTDDKLVSSQGLYSGKPRRSSMWEKSVYHDASEGLDSPQADASERLDSPQADASEGLDSPQADASERLDSPQADASEGLDSPQADVGEELDSPQADASEGLDSPQAKAGKDKWEVTSEAESLPDLIVSDSEPVTNQKHEKLPSNFTTERRHTSKSGSSARVSIICSDSSDEDFESFLSKVRTPLRERLHVNQIQTESSIDDFLVDDDESVSEEDDVEAEDNSGVFHVNVDRKMDTVRDTKRKPKHTSSVPSYRDVIEIDSDSDEENFVIKPKPKSTPKATPTEMFKTPKSVVIKQRDVKSLSSIPAKLLDHTSTASFLKSLSSTVPDQNKHIEAGRYTRQFSKLREELTKRLFTLYNSTVFDNKLPQDLPIKWNARLLKTAGYCRYKRHRNSKAQVSQSVEIELSTKVCDSAERVRDTLIHELCHAAVWIINGTRDGHGPYWKFWARKSNFVHPELPVINRCHDYSISTKYTYKCVQCGYQIGRHSKSLDTVKKVCGLCHGKFELLVSGKSSTSSKKEGDGTPYTPRAPSKFALFVKENYKVTKQSNSNFKHSDVMKALSKEFAEKNKIKDS